MEVRTTTTDGADAVFACSLLALALAAATNAVVAVIDAMEWAWWVAGGCALIALALAGARTDPEEHMTPGDSGLEHKADAASVR
ncbi:hypothetical protein [Umezawaea sp. Da 62-37]|uniref:hypothetical protein n=1 Tax=Umezawaea sp. Da 62-37 TaxID=3075927 RepID=UPI0028F74AD6|nr:hypothetical protein [Umezawaea sp. Da 62-37]WNV82904.1 hypothetical protein RM788_32520 [Umezawaea sp. Da 62-37]